MKILNVHEHTELKGGAEVYISQLGPLLEQYGHSSLWISINILAGEFRVADINQNILAKGNDWAGLIPFIKKYLSDNQINFINLHNIFNKEVVEFFLDELPVFKFSHSPVMVCPGKNKFWRYSERICDIKYGLHCFWHIYSEGCANRHPASVIKAYDFVNFEINKASLRYRKIIVMSEYIKAGLIECGVPDERIVCNPYFTPIADQNNWYEGAREAKSLLFMGRLESTKGPHIMIESIASLLKNDKQLHLDIVGDGIMMSELTELVKKLELENKVTFHGWLGREEIDTLMSQCYLVIFPSIYPEAFGIVGIEAMMRGKPVVGFDVGGVSTWLKNGETGYLVKSKDKQQLKHSIETLLNNSSVYQEMSRNSREQAVGKFAPAVHVEKLINLYNNLSS